MIHQKPPVRRDYKRSQVFLYSTLLPMMLLAYSLGGMLESTKRILLVLLGFSSIVFVHELGHFLVARACSVRCEAFSIGIGPRLFGWRKNFGLSFGSDPVDKLREKTKKAKLEGGDTGRGIEPGTKNLTADILGKTKTNVDLTSLGECDYRVSMLPLGGYVRMLGQDDMDPTKVSGDPRAFNMRPVWQRMSVVSAGVIMNLIFAAVVFSIVFHPSLGVVFPPAEVGNVAFGSPAYKDGKGMRIGDKIIAINGKKPLGQMEFTDVVIASALSDGDETVRLEVERPGVPGTLIFDLKPVRQESTGFLGIGIEPMQSLNIYVDKDLLAKVAENRKWSPERMAEIKKLEPGDSITAVNGTPITTFSELYPVLQASHGAPVTLTVRNRKAPQIADRDVKITPELQPRMGVKSMLSNYFGIGPRTRIEAVVPGDPADKAQMKAGDVITLLGTRTDPSLEQLSEIIEANPKKPLAVKVLRDGKVESLIVTPMENKKKDGRGKIGIAMGIAGDDLSVIVRDPIAAGSMEALLSGKPAQIAAIDGMPVKSWSEVTNTVHGKKAGEAVALTFKIDGGEVVYTQVMDSALAARFENETAYLMNLSMENAMILQRAKNSWEGVLMGMEHTEKFVKQVYMTLRGMIFRTVSPTNLHGIIVIGKVGHDVQDRGFIWLCYLMAMVSVNLAVANFLPLPVVDGGLFLLLILEKIRGKPLSLKLQSAIQTAGVVLLAALFIFVTFNDILFLFTQR